MPTIINTKTCYATVGNMSRSGTMITLHFFAAKADAVLIYEFFVDGAYYVNVGTLGLHLEIFNVSGWYQKDRSSMQMREAYAEITLVFDKQNVQGLVPTTGSNVRYDPIYNLSTSTDERPIEQHPNFLCKWTYNLYELVITGGTPSGASIPWADTDTNPAAIHDGYLWSHNPPSSPDAEHEYIQIQAATDFGMDTYLVPRPVVTSTIFYKTRAVQTSDIQHVGKLKAPAETFIYGNTNTQWLITSGDVADASNDMRAVTTSYTYNPDHWKTKVYQVAT